MSQVRSAMHSWPPWLPRDWSESFVGSRWFGRGWTLQELMAPAEVLFFNGQWEELGTKHSLLTQLKRATGINEHYLRPEADSSSIGLQASWKSASVAQKMCWASKRETTRIEDAAYSLLGIFEVNMPLLYGEGANAFLRLQEEILKYSDDQTIFAWDSPTIAPTGLLAPSPSCFRDKQYTVHNFSDFMQPENWSPVQILGRKMRLTFYTWRPFNLTNIDSLLPDSRGVVHDEHYPENGSLYGEQRLGFSEQVYRWKHFVNLVKCHKSPIILAVLCSSPGLNFTVSDSIILQHYPGTRSIFYRCHDIHNLKHIWTTPGSSGTEITTIDAWLKYTNLVAGSSLCTSFLSHETIVRVNHPSMSTSLQRIFGDSLATEPRDSQSIWVIKVLKGDRNWLVFSDDRDADDATSFAIFISRRGENLQAHIESPASQKQKDYVIDPVNRHSHPSTHTSDSHWRMPHAARDSEDWRDFKGVRESWEEGEIFEGVVQRRIQRHGFFNIRRRKSRGMPEDAELVRVIVESSGDDNMSLGQLVNDVSGF